MIYFFPHAVAPGGPVFRGRKRFSRFHSHLVLKTVDPYEQLIADPRGPALPRNEPGEGYRRILAASLLVLLVFLVLCVLGLTF
jgi:hypothetical protein